MFTGQSKDHSNKKETNKKLRVSDSEENSSDEASPKPKEKVDEKVKGLSNTRSIKTSHVERRDKEGTIDELFVENEVSSEELTSYYEGYRDYSTTRRDFIDVICSCITGAYFEALKRNEFDFGNAIYRSVTNKIMSKEETKNLMREIRAKNPNEYTKNAESLSKLLKDLIETKGKSNEEVIIEASKALGVHIVCFIDKRRKVVKCKEPHNFTIPKIHILINSEKKKCYQLLKSKEDLYKQIKEKEKENDTLTNNIESITKEIENTNKSIRSDNDKYTKTKRELSTLTDESVIMEELKRRIEVFAKFIALIKATPSFEKAIELAERSEKSSEASNEKRSKKRASDRNNEDKDDKDQPGIEKIKQEFEKLKKKCEDYTNAIDKINNAKAEENKEKDDRRKANEKFKAGDWIRKRCRKCNNTEKEVLTRFTTCKDYCKIHFCHGCLKNYEVPICFCCYTPFESRELKDH